MNNLSQNSGATPESIWALILETNKNLNIIAQNQAETDKILTEKFAETYKLQKENERIFNERFAETDKLYKEIALLQKENERILNEKFAETDKLVKENALRMKSLQSDLGGMANSHGSFAEEYFFNSFKNGQKNFFGEKFDEISKNLTHFWEGLRGEYDIVLYNHVSVAIIEVKYKAEKKDIQDVLKKAETFRILFPNYKDFKIYLGLASLVFQPILEQICIENGIAIIKQVGDMVVINDKNLKTF